MRARTFLVAALCLALVAPAGAEAARFNKQLKLKTPADGDASIAAFKFKAAGGKKPKFKIDKKKIPAGLTLIGGVGKLKGGPKGSYVGALVLLNPKGGLLARARVSQAELI